MANSNTKKRPMQARTIARLQQSDTGRALLMLIDRAGGTPADLARRLGYSNDAVGQWVRNGSISIRGATNAESVGLATRLEARPDIEPGSWPVNFPGPVPGEKPVAQSDDAKLLVRLAEKRGSVNALCEELGISVGKYHNWKSRGKIPAAHKPRLSALDGTD